MPITDGPFAAYVWNVTTTVTVSPAVMRMIAPDGENASSLGERGASLNRQWSGSCTLYRPQPH